MFKLGEKRVDVRFCGDVMLDLIGPYVEGGPVYLRFIDAEPGEPGRDPDLLDYPTRADHYPEPMLLFTFTDERSARTLERLARLAAEALRLGESNQSGVA